MVIQTEQTKMIMLIQPTMSQVISFCLIMNLLLNLLPVNVNSLSTTFNPMETQQSKLLSSSNSSLPSSPSSESEFASPSQAFKPILPIVFRLSHHHSHQSASPASLASSSCPTSCYCDQDNLYVSCIGDDQWETSLPLELSSTVIRLEIANYNVSSSSLDPRYLSSLVNLKELKLQSLSLISLEPFTFNKITSLERLDLSVNRLTELSINSFHGLSSLKFLDLSSNKLSSIDEAFIGLSSVESLNLRDNCLVNLTVNSFIGLVQLTYLNLDANYIISIQLGTFLQLTRLGHLIISNNPISLTTRFDSMSMHLRYVDLSNITLTTIPHGIDPYIRDLRLSGNSIQKIASGDFDNYLWLNVLVLDNNELSDIEPDSLGRLEYLIKLWLINNNLTNIPSELPPSLRELYLSQNQITVLQNISFAQLTLLERLDLSHNCIKFIESKSFEPLINLIELDLSDNQINQIIDIQFPDNLKILDLSENSIKTLSINIFSENSALEELMLNRIPLNNKKSDSNYTENIGKNNSAIQIPIADELNFQSKRMNYLKKLSFIDSPWLAEFFLSSTHAPFILPNLSEINLIGTQLTRLTINVSADWNNLNLLEFDSNQWDCSTPDGIAFAVWLNRVTQINNQITIKPNKNSIKCWLPENLRGYSIIQLNGSDYLNNYQSNSVSKQLVYQQRSSSASSTEQLDNRSGQLNLTDHADNNLVNQIKSTNSLNQQNRTTFESSTLPSGTTIDSLPSAKASSSSSSLSSLPETLMMVKRNDDKALGNLTDYHLIVANVNISSKSNNQNKNLLKSSKMITSSSFASYPAKELLNHGIALPVSSSDDDNSSEQINHQPINHQPIKSSETLKRSLHSISSSSSSNLASTHHSTASHLVRYGIISFMFGSLIIAIMLCLAVLIMIKSRKIYTTLGKNAQEPEIRSWLRRSVSYLSGNDEVSFISLSETVESNRHLQSTTDAYHHQQNLSEVSRNPNDDESINQSSSLLKQLIPVTTRTNVI